MAPFWMLTVRTVVAKRDRPKIDSSMVIAQRPSEKVNIGPHEFDRGVGVLVVNRGLEESVDLILAVAQRPRAALLFERFQIVGDGRRFHEGLLAQRRGAVGSTRDNDEQREHRADEEARHQVPEPVPDRDAPRLDDLADALLDDDRVLAPGRLGRQEAAVELRAAVVAVHALRLVLEITLLTEKRRGGHSEGKTGLWRADRTSL